MGGSATIVFGAIFSRKCIDSRKTNIVMTFIPCCTFHLIEYAAAKIRTFRGNRARIFEAVTRYVLVEILPSKTCIVRFLMPLRA